MTNGNNKNLRRGGFYWIDNKPYVSVTKVLEVLDKPALRYWFGKEVYYAPPYPSTGWTIPSPWPQRR